jgi:RNA polymerase sigma factor (sigma-70 family)
VSEQSDEELMVAYARNAVESRGAFEELYSRYAGVVFGIMRRGYRSEHSAQDLVQQTFLQLHRGRRDYRSGMPLRPWILTIARNVLRDRIRYERRRPAMTGIEDVQPIDPGQSVEGRSDLRQATDAAIASLPAGLRSLIEARLVHQESYEQIARQLGVSKGAAKVRLHRAIAALRKKLVEAGYEVA